MGCCLATNKAASSGGQKNQHRHSSSNGRECVPPSMEEEETVKEVLSETPAPPKPALAIAKIEDEEKKKKIKNATTPTPKLSALQKIEEEVMKMKMEKKRPSVFVVAEEISEVSEICSLSESVSTTTVTERREDDDGEVKQRVDRSPAKFPRNRSYSGDLTGKRERVVGRSPVRRSDPSPGRRNDGGVKSGFGREGAQTTTTTTARRRLGTNVQQRRDSVESSCRRSRSPATRTDGGGGGGGGGGNRSVMGRSPSTRKTVQSPGRARSTQLEQNRKLEEETSNSREGMWPPSNESLENPLVSLECFIFL